MQFHVSGTVRNLRQLAAGAARILDRTLVAIAAPVLRAVISADDFAPAATGDSSQPRAATSAPSTGSDQPLHAVDGPSLAVANAADVRAWARSRGLHVAERGRISRTIIDQYLEAHTI